MLRRHSVYVPTRIVQAAIGLVRYTARDRIDWTGEWQAGGVPIDPDRQRAPKRAWLDLCRSALRAPDHAEGAPDPRSAVLLRAIASLERAYPRSAFASVGACAGWNEAARSASSFQDAAVLLHKLGGWLLCGV